MSKPVIVSGIKPTGDLHLGNYLGMLRQAVALQNSEQYDCFYMIVDLHAMTQKFTAAEMSSRTFDMAVDLLAAGIDPKKSVLFAQSQVQEHANLAWIFNCITSMGELQRMVEYKEKVEEGHVPNVGLFDYPVLMAADILLYKAETIPVGEDQRQHVELTRTIARSFNSKFPGRAGGETFKEPKAVMTKTPRVMSLSDPLKKMSKSMPAGCVFMHDAPEVIRKKIMASVTDSESSIGYDPQKRPGISNLILLYSEFAGISTDAVLSQFRDAKYSEFKSALADVIIAAVESIQEKRAELLKDKKKIMAVLADGAARARAVAERTMAEVREKTGLI